MNVGRSSDFHRFGAWRRSLLSGLVALLFALQPLVAMGLASQAIAGHSADGAAPVLACRISITDPHRSSERDTHSDFCRFCLNASCAGPALASDGDEFVPIAVRSNQRFVSRRIFVLAAIDRASGWGSSWTAQAPPVLG